MIGGIIGIVNLSINDNKCMRNDKLLLYNDKYLSRNDKS